MTIYVDELRDYNRDQIKPSAQGYGTMWCHLVTDDEPSELHDFAQKLGLQRGWFQDHPTIPHYDLTPGMRKKAVAAGATEVSSKEMARAIAERIVNREP